MGIASAQITRDAVGAVRFGEGVVDDALEILFAQWRDLLSAGR